MTISSELHMPDPSTSTIGGGGGPTGFNFDNWHRNKMIEQIVSTSSTNTSAGGGGGGSVLPCAKKTGTTIVGMIYDGGVVLGADTRSTSGTEVAEKNCIKIHYLAPNIYCCGAGTAADTLKTTELVASQLELLRLDTHSIQSRLLTAVTKLKRMLYRYQGHIGAALVLGGCDINGPQIFQIHPHGSTAKLPYTTMGSGSLAAMSIFESMWHPSMNEAEALALVQRAISAGIYNDLGSGGSCDTCIIRMDGTFEYKKQALKENDVQPLRATVQRSNRLNMAPGVTPVLNTSFQPNPMIATSGVTLADVTVTEMEVDA